MAEVFDVIVVGIGGMGSFHGVTRIIRLPYYEDPTYVPLLGGDYEPRAGRERANGERLPVTTVSIDGGPEEDELFQRALAAGRPHGLPHQVLTGAEVNARFPGHRLPTTTRAEFQPQGASERFIVTQMALASILLNTVQRVPSCKVRRSPGPHQSDFEPLIARGSQHPQSMSKLI
jgi:hypothetical protein